MYDQNKTKLVRCIVCGAIFDASLDICPVCKAGRDKFEPYEEEDHAFVNNTDETFLILGNGVAGIEAADAIRKRNETCKIIIVTNEKVLGYNRPMLTKILSTLTQAEEIAMHEESWYAERKIEHILGTSVKQILPDEKAVLLLDGKKLSYDKCIYSLGAYCFVPPIQGSNLKKVIAIRNIEDVQKIREYAAEIKNTVVIGGGVLGLEAAWEMSKVSHVTVLEIADKLMVRQLDDEGGRFLENIIRSKGIDFQLNAQIEEITGDSQATGVKLKTGEEYPADLVINSSV
jgi:NAD(P)H-nitrite reductase large subunit